MAILRVAFKKVAIGWQFREWVLRRVAFRRVASQLEYNAMTALGRTFSLAMHAQVVSVLVAPLT